MAWVVYKVTYELGSPLHIGYHKVGNVQRTRYYIPARNLWGAVTEALTRRGFAIQELKTARPDDYQAVGNWVKEHCAFSYWFIEEEGKLLFPRYENGKLKYGPYTTTEFERRYLDVHITTALVAATTSAAEGSLHEVEFITPLHPVQPGEKEEVMQTRVTGWVFLDETARKILGEESKWRAWLGNLQVGGERRYGFGHVQLGDFVEGNDNLVGNYNLILDGLRPQIKIKAPAPLLAHTLVRGDIQAKGHIEPLVGRETAKSAAFGSILTSAAICWTPGTTLLADATFEIGETWCLCEA